MATIAPERSYTDQVAGYYSDAGFRAVTFQRCPLSSYLADHVTESPSIAIRHETRPDGLILAGVFACRFAFRTAIASSSGYIGPVGVGVGVGVAVQANAISTTTNPSSVGSEVLSVNVRSHPVGTGRMSRQNPSKARKTLYCSGMTICSPNV